MYHCRYNVWVSVSTPILKEIFTSLVLKWVHFYLLQGLPNSEWDRKLIEPVWKCIVVLNTAMCFCACLGYLRDSVGRLVTAMCPSFFPVEIQSRAMSSQKRTGRQPSGPLCLCWDPCNLLGVSLADYRALCSPLKAVSRTFLLTDFPSVVVKEPRIQAFTYCFFSCCKFLRVTQFLAPSSSLLQAQAWWDVQGQPCKYWWQLRFFFLSIETLFSGKAEWQREGETESIHPLGWFPKRPWRLRLGQVKIRSLKSHPNLPRGWQWVICHFPGCISGELHWKWSHQALK